MNKVMLDVKCDSFIALDTDLTIDQAINMEDEQVYNLFMTKYKERALKKYFERMKQEDFSFELDFYYEENADE